MHSVAWLARAIIYGFEATRLLWRRPSLLLVAAVLGAYTTVDTLVVNSYTWRDTALAQDMRRWDQSLPRKDQPAQTEARTRRAREMQERLTITSPSGPSLDLGGTLVAGWSLLYGPPGKDLNPAHTPPIVLFYLVMLWALSGPVPIAITVFTAGGFLTVVKELVATGEVRWQVLLPGARRVFWRLLFLSLLSLLVYSLIGEAGGLRGAAGEIVSWMLVAAALLLVLADVAVVWDDCRVIEALARSVRTVTRSLPTALVLVLSAGVVQWLAQRPLSAAWAQMAPMGAAEPARASSPLPPALLGMMAASVVGAWFYAASFVWYRAMAARPAATERVPAEKAQERGWWEE